MQTNATIESFDSLRKSGHAAVVELFQREVEAVQRQDFTLERQLFAQRIAISQSLAAIAEAEFKMLNSPQSIAAIADGLERSAAAARNAVGRLRSLEKSLKAAGEILSILRKLTGVLA